MKVLDVTDPGDPIEIGFYDTPGSAVDVESSGNLAYVACEQQGLFIYKHIYIPVGVQEELRPEFCIKTGLNSLSYEVTDKAELEVFAVDGGRVVDQAVTGHGTWSADKLPEGVYFARLSTAGFTRTAKLIVIR